MNLFFFVRYTLILPSLEQIQNSVNNCKFDPEIKSGSNMGSKNENFSIFQIKLFFRAIFLFNFQLNSNSNNITGK